MEGTGGLTGVPALRVAQFNRSPLRPDRDYVLYWMIANRRVSWNFALDRAVELAQELKKPLVIFEALRCDYRWASDRFHLFVAEGMAENARRLRLENAPVHYFPYLEEKKGAGKGLLKALAEQACAVVTDRFPCFFLPRMVEAAGERLDVALEAVDSNGLLPLAASDRVWPTAFSFRSYLHKNLREHLDALPRAKPFAGVELPGLTALPREVTARWKPTDAEAIAADPSRLKVFPIDHEVPRAVQRGGSAEADLTLERFLKRRLARYPDDRSEPAKEGTSQISPYLHWGHLSVHQIFAELTAREGWSPKKLASKGGGKREGWWGMSAPAEAFLDELVTWRELAFHFCAKRDDYDQPSAIPDWAQKTLDKHRQDKRPHLLTLERLEKAETEDPLWNAIQRQLVRDGWFHNAMRMLWGKKILQWSRSPEDAFRSMESLMGKYSLDGRNPNSYAGYLWILGQFDRPWGPEREVFGTVRYMSSESARRKADLKPYLEKYGS